MDTADFRLVIDELTRVQLLFNLDFPAKHFRRFAPERRLRQSATPEVLTFRFLQRKPDVSRTHEFQHGVSLRRE